MSRVHKFTAGFLIFGLGLTHSVVHPSWLDAIDALVTAYVVYVLLRA